MMSFFRKKPHVDDHGTSQPISQFSLNEVDLLAEVEAWAEMTRPLVLASSSAAEADYGVLLHGIGQILKSLRDPDRKIGQSVRSEVMDVLRQEGLDTHGFDPMSMIQCLRKLMQRAMVQNPGQRINATQDHDASADLRRQIAVLQAQNATLQEVIDHLSHAPSSGVVHDAIV